MHPQKLSLAWHSLPVDYLKKSLCAPNPSAPQTVQLWWHPEIIRCIVRSTAALPLIFDFAKTHPEAKRLLYTIPPIQAPIVQGEEDRMKRKACRSVWIFSHHLLLFSM